MNHDFQSISRFVLTDDGRLFHTRAEATGKALSPSAKYCLLVACICFFVPCSIPGKLLNCRRKTLRVGLDERRFLDKMARDED